MRNKCAVPECNNKPAFNGLCRKHSDLLRPRGTPRFKIQKGARVLASRISDKAKAKLEKVAEAASAGSAYVVGSVILETITEKDAVRILDEAAKT